MQMLKKLFKSDGKYYLELDSVKDSQPVKNIAKTAKKIGETAKDKIEEIQDSKPVKEAVSTAKDKLESITTTEEKPAKTKKSSQKTKTSKVATENQPAKQPASTKNSGASSFEQPFWVAAMYKNNGSGQGTSAGADKTFAPDHLMPTITTSRRRPGPSLKMFKDMANKARTPGR
jgi:hypothetical protein